MLLLPKGEIFGWIARKAWINIISVALVKKRVTFFTEAAPKDPKVAALFWRLRSFKMLAMFSVAYLLSGYLISSDSVLQTKITFSC